MKPSLICCLFLLLAAPLPAQQAAGAAETRRLLEAGSFPEARAAVLQLWSARGDSLRGDARAEALFLRALLAPSVEDAETDYTRVTVEHPFSPDADAALLRLALLRLERGERESADRLLERLESGYPQSPLLATAGAWRQRIARTEQPAGPPVNARGWAVQVGALRAEDGARALADRLSRRGFAAQARPRSSDGLIRVRIRGYTSSAAAEAAARDVRAAGFEAVVVRDDH